MWRRSLLLIPALALLMVSLVRANDPEKMTPASVPFELLETRHMAVKIKINGKGPYRVIFDTGAPVTVVNNRIARDSGLIAKDKPKPQGLLGMLAPTQLRIKSLELGQLKAADVPAIVMDHPTVEAMNQAFGEIEGILGFPFFARYRMTLDYQTKRLTFEPNGYQPADIMQSLMAKIMAKNKEEVRILAPAALWGLVVRKAETDERPGVVVAETFPGGAAADAGIQRGDRILTLDGRWTDCVTDCYAAAANVLPGTAVVVKVMRAGKEMAYTFSPTSGL